MLKYIKYKDEQHPLRISYYVLKRLQEELKKGDITKGFDVASLDFSTLEVMLYFGLERGAKIEGKDFKFTREDMEDVLDECYMDFIRLIPEFFPSQTESEKKLTSGEQGKTGKTLDITN